MIRIEQSRHIHIYTFHRKPSTTHHMQLSIILVIIEKSTWLHTRSYRSLPVPFPNAQLSENVSLYLSKNGLAQFEIRSETADTLPMPNRDSVSPSFRESHLLWVIFSGVRDHLLFLKTRKILFLKTITSIKVPIIPARLIP